MTEISEPDLNQNGAAPSAAVLLSGVDALVRLLGLRHELDEREGLNTATMVSGYPGSPLGTFDLALEQAAATLDPHRVVHRPGLNEELAAATVWGSQMGATVEYADVDGVAGAWYGKTPGLDRSGDVMKHANAMGAGPNGGVVMICGDDPTAKSSTLPCDSQYTFEDACIPVLYPGDPQDVIDLGVHAFRLSRYAGPWVGLKIVTSVADGLGSVVLDPDRHDPQDPTDLLIDGTPWRHEPLATIGPHQIPRQELLVSRDRLIAAKAYVRHNGLDRVVGARAGAPLGVICAGKTYFDVVQAFADLGLSLDDLGDAGVRVLKLAMTYPLVEETVLGFADSVDELLVIEEKRPFVEAQLRTILHEAGHAVPVRGKRDGDGMPLASTVGELGPSEVVEILTRVMPSLAPVTTKASRTFLPILAPPGRAPGYCSGCPHNRSTVIPDGALVGGGVGCHGIMYFEARNQGMRSLPPTPMGAEGVPWIGLGPFVADPHLIQNIGDGTLSHSGVLAIRASVAARSNITFKILYNAAVAMTGGQDVTGLMDVPALTRSLAAEGVARIVVCAEDPDHYPRRAKWADGVKVYDRDRLPAVQEELRTVEGVSVIVYDQRCAAEARRMRKAGELEEPPRRVVINEAVCEGCGDCSTKSNCLSVLPLMTEFGEKREIHDPSCNRDYTCLEGDCPSFVTLTPAPPGRRRRKRGATAAARRPALPSGSLPMPNLPELDDQFGIYFSGIGGTGVVTANRIIATAAEAAGLFVSGMDQTGLSQKAGAVVSHLHLARDREALGSPTVSTAGADLYLSGDILQAAAAHHLDKIETDHTVAVVDIDLTPTAAMLQTDAAPPDVAVFVRSIADRVGSGRAAFVDSKDLADRVFANHLLGNVILVGAAFQLGGLPLSLEHLELAMHRRGRGGADTREAFEWGRWVAHDPDAVQQAIAAAAQPGDSASIHDPSPAAVAAAGPLVAGRHVPAELRELVVRRTAQVVDYQSPKLAARFLDLVDRAVRVDDEAHGWAFSHALIEAWFKLLTYKDEYEVARLHLKVDYDRVADDLGIDGAYAVTYQLHPPFLRRLGRHEKLPMGKPYELGFRALRRLKRLRGTAFDPFGLDRDRRSERAVIEEFEALVTSATEPGSDLSYDVLVRLATSAMSIKGYAQIKEDAIARWRVEVAEVVGAKAGSVTSPS